MPNPVVSFFSQFLGVIGGSGGYYPGGYQPDGAVEGSPPFQSAASDSGQTISVVSAMQLSTVFSCVRLISETVATLPLVLKAPDASGRLVEQTASPTYRMLRYSPNSYMTAVEFWEMMTVSLCFWGNGFAEKVKVAGRIVAFLPFRPEYMTVYRRGTEIRYLYKLGTVVRDMSADEVLHIKGFGVDGLVGLSPIAMGRQSIGRALAADDASSSVMRSGLSASGFIKYASAFPTPEQREGVRSQIANFTGSSNTGKVMVLENGMEYSPISMNPVDAQMLETRLFNIEDLCRWFGTPPQLVGHIDKSSSWASSLETLILLWIKTGLRAYLTRIEQAVSKSLGLAYTSVLAFDLDELERGDSAARSALYASAAQNGYKTRNEIRKLEGDPAIAGGDGLTVQSNLVPLNKLGKTPPAPVVPPPDPSATPDPTATPDPAGAKP